MSSVYVKALILTYSKIFNSTWLCNFMIQMYVFFAIYKTEINYRNPLHKYSVKRRIQQFDFFTTMQMPFGEIRNILFFNKLFQSKSVKSTVWKFYLKCILWKSATEW